MRADLKGHLLIFMGESSGGINRKGKVNYAGSEIWEYLGIPIFMDFYPHIYIPCVQVPFFPIMPFTWAWTGPHYDFSLLCHSQPWRVSCVAASRFLCPSGADDRIFLHWYGHSGFHSGPLNHSYFYVLLALK